MHFLFKFSGRIATDVLENYPARSFSAQASLSLSLSPELAENKTAYAGMKSMEGKKSKDTRAGPAGENVDLGIGRGDVLCSVQEEEEEKLHFMLSRQQREKN